MIRVRVAGEERWAAIEDAGRLRDALGQLAAGRASRRPSSSRCPTRSATSSAATPAPTARSPPRRSPRGGASARPWPSTPCAGWSPPAGWSRASCCPTENGGGVHGLEYCDAEVLRLLRRRSLAALRAEVEPVPPVELARFLPQWQSVGGAAARPRGAGAGRRAARRSGAAGQRAREPGPAVPRRRLLPRPARRADERRRGALARPRVAARRRRLGVAAPRRHRPPDARPARPTARSATAEQAVLDALAGGGAYFFRTLADAGRQHRRRAARWPTSGRSSGPAGSATTPSRPCAPCSSGGRTAHKRSRPGPRTHPVCRPARLARAAVRSARAAGDRRSPTRSGPAAGAGRWSLLPDGRARRHRARLRHRRGAARPLRRGHPRVGRGRGGARRVRRRLPGARRRRGVRPGAARLLRRVAGRLAVRHHRCRRPAPRRRPPGRRRGRPRRARRWCWPPPTRPTPTAPRSPGRTGPSAPDDADPERGDPARARAGAGKRGHQPAARPARSSSSSTASSSSTSSGAARRCSPGPTTRSRLQGAADALALAVREGALGRLTVEKADGGAVLGSDHPLASALAKAGFHATPRGLRLRR